MRSRSARFRGMMFAWMGTAVNGQMLYDGAIQTLPEEQGWAIGGVGQFSSTLTNSSVLFDTLTAASVQAGWARVLEPGLDRPRGFALLFRMQLDAETHHTTRRAGCSVILLGDNQRGIELGFWTNTVFAQSDNPLFSHVEEAVLPTKEGSTDYALFLFGTNYTLRANGVPLLSGPVRDYRSFGGLFSPYRIPDFLFIGDNTSSAAAAVQISRVAAIRPPNLATFADGAIRWNGVAHESFIVQGSTDLALWTNLARVTSGTPEFSFTNAPTKPAGFLHVIYP